MYEQDPFWEERPRRQPGTPLGIVVFLLSMALLLFAPYLMPGELGAWSTVISEAMLALLPILIALLFRMDMREVFPFRRVKSRDIGGTIVLWMGFFGLDIMVITLVISLLPRQLSEMFETGQGTAYSLGALPFIPLLLVLALTPAVCEEILARGFLQYTFRNLNKWVCIFLTGILFGVMHIDPIRVVSASILGVGLAYLRYKTGNLWMPMLFHFVHNGLSAVSLYFTSQLLAAPLSYEALPGIEWGSVFAALPVGGFFWGLGAPFLIFGASLLLEPPRPLGRHKYRDKRPQFILALVATGLILAGLAVSLVRFGQIYDYSAVVDSITTEALRVAP